MTTTMDTDLLRVRTEQALVSLEKEIAVYESRKVLTIHDATTYEDAVAGAALWELLIGERRFAIGLLRGLLVDAPDPIDLSKWNRARIEDPTEGWCEAEMREAWGR